MKCKDFSWLGFSESHNQFAKHVNLKAIMDDYLTKAIVYWIYQLRNIHIDKEKYYYEDHQLILY